MEVLVFFFLIMIYLLINLAEANRIQGKYILANRQAIIPYGLIIVNYGLIMSYSRFHTVTGFFVFMVALTGILLIVPPIRRGVIKLFPLQVNNHVHIFTLSLSLSIIIAYIYLKDNDYSNPSSLFSDWIGTFLYVLFALVGVGFLTRRNAKEAFERLGIVKPDLNLIAFGIIVGIVSALLNMLLESVADQLGWTDPFKDELLEKLFAPYFSSLFGILTVGLTAGIGEEAIFRGALQPRLGIFFTSLLFTLIHVQYSLDVTILSVFGMALLLGWIRSRYNTTLCIIIHSIHNIVIAVVAYFS